MTARDGRSGARRHVRAITPIRVCAPSLQELRVGGCDHADAGLDHRRVHQRTRQHLRRVKRGAVDQRAGLAWVPEQAPSTVSVVRNWQPNVVAMQVPQTNYVARVVTQKVPTQVCRFVDEQVVQKVPVQTCRMVQEEQVRRVPVTTYRQVVERIPQQQQVQVCKMVEEEVVRRIPVTTCRLVYEERVDKVPVQVCKMVAVQSTVRVPRVVEKQIPVTYNVRVPRTVCMRVPIVDESPCGPVAPSCCGGAATALDGYYSEPPATIVPPATTILPPSQPYYQQPTPVPPKSRQGSTGRSGNGADKAPALGPNEVVPGPVDEEAPSAAPAR